MKLFCYCFVDFKAQLFCCFEFKWLWHLLVENTVNYCSWWKTRACVSCFFLYFSLFGNFISLPSQWHWWWSLLFQLKYVLKLAGESLWQCESLVLLSPLNATRPSLVSLSHLEVTGVKAYLVRRTQPYVVSMDGFVIMCPLFSALCVELGTSWQPFRCLPLTCVGTKEQVGYVQKDLPALPLKC